MNSESFESIEQNPGLDIAQLKFRLTLDEYKDDDESKNTLINSIKERDMAPYYEIVCEDLNWVKDEKLLEEMKARNEEEITKLNEAIQYAAEKLTAIEHKNAILKKANYYIKIGDKNSAIQTLLQAFGLTVALGYKMDNILQCIFVGLFFTDLDLVRKNIDRADELIPSGIDFQRRNRLNVYKGLYYLAIRNFKLTAELYLNLVSTFSSFDIMTNVQFIHYTVYAAILTLTRSEFRDKIIRGADILQVINATPILNDYVYALYNCHYADFFISLANVERRFKEDMFLHEHYKYYVREMKRLAYRQLLTSYKSLSLQYMADQFGVTADYIENDMHNFIISGKIHCKIDKVNNTIINTNLNFQHDSLADVIKNGDIVLNRVEKLTRILNI